jgi:hypothetical protein
VRRRLIAQCRNSGDLLLPRPIVSFVIASEDRPDAIVRCSPPGSGYSPLTGPSLDLKNWRPTSYICPVIANRGGRTTIER